MINSTTDEYYRNYSGVYLIRYIQNRKKQDRHVNMALFIFLALVVFISIIISKPIFAYNFTDDIKLSQNSNHIHIQKNFEENIKNKYPGSYINFPTKGIAHIKQTKYIKSKPIKINIIEINTKINHNLKIKPQIAGKKLNSKATVRKIANKEQAIIAINGGFFKPQTGVPLGALMIDREILTGPIYNRVGMAIFEEGNDISFKTDKISFDIKAKNGKNIVKIDNINQPRMLSTLTLMYTDAWGELSPIAPSCGYNVLIRNGKIALITQKSVKIEKNDVIIQAPTKIVKQLGKLNESVEIDIKLQENLQEADHIIGAGPYLVKNSEIYVDYKEQKLEAISGRNPRSAIGFKNDGTFIIATIDGREKASVGMTLYELARYMKSIGCEYAINFDGGSSSALYVKGKIVNKAVSKEGIAISNALLVMEENPNELQLSSIK